MTSRTFWEEVRSKWIIEAPPEIEDIITGTGGQIDPSLLKDPWEMEEVPFDLVDHEKAFEAALTGKDTPINQSAVDKLVMQGKAENAEQNGKGSKAKNRPKLNSEKFEGFMEKQTFPDYIEACRLLKACELPRKLNDLYGELMERMIVLNDAMEQNKGTYRPDVRKFHEYYMPEALQMTATYLEYISIGVEDEVAAETENDVVEACTALLQAVNDKIDEIFRQVSLEIQAQAKALGMMIGMDGHVKSDYRIDK